MVFESRLPIYGVDEIPLVRPIMLRVDHARWGQTPADLRRLATNAPHPRTRERFLALYEITQESCATRVAAPSPPDGDGVAASLQHPRPRGYQRTGPPFARRSKPALATCRPTLRRSPAHSRSRSSAA